MKKLPIGVQDFEELRSSDFYYVDKTEYYAKVFEAGKYFFFSRPRRFGKSLMLSTIKYLYLGRRDLFNGLWIENNWDWEDTYPVIYLDLNDALTRMGGNIEKGLMHIISLQADANDVKLTSTDPGTAIRELIQLIAQKKKAVVLVDEYDKPITDYIQEPEMAELHTKALKAFYEAFKSQDAYLKKVIITGVSKYGKVSIFSDLNNLADVSMLSDTAISCGYTQEELEEAFADRIELGCQTLKVSKEELLETIRIWYNGYTFDDWQTAKVYNPFSILNFFNSYQFRNYWFVTGTPTFLTELIAEDQFNPRRLEYLKSTELIFKSSDLQHIDALSLLYQTGYLTIKDIVGPPARRRYILGFPNQEVRISFMTYLLAEYMDERTSHISSDVVVGLEDALWEQDWEGFFKVLNAVFASIPYSLFENSEAYYHAITHVCLTLTGYLVLSEVLTNKGRIDSVLEMEDRIVIFELKMDSTADAALQQIHEKGYAQRYGRADKELVLVGVNFEQERRQVVEWKLESE